MLTNADSRSSVHIGVLSELIRYLERRGHSPETFYRLAGLKATVPTDPDARIPVEVMKRSWKVALGLTRDPALGLSVGADYSSDSHGILGHLIAHSDTLGDALRVFCRYFALFSGGLIVELKVTRGRASLYLSIDDPDPDIWPLAVERTLAAMVAVARNDAIGDFGIDRVEFGYDEPSYAEAYRRFFRASCCFGATCTRITFPSAHLDLRMRYRHSSLQSLFEREIESTYRVLIDREKATAAKLGNQFPRLLDHGLISAQAAAGALNLSLRTLHRHLASEGVTYLELLDKARYERSMRLMGAPDLSIEEIAFASGFADSSGFFRAFKRWTGVAPRVYRMSNQR